MRITALICLLLVLPLQQLSAQDRGPEEQEPVELPAEAAADPAEPDEPEVILEPPGEADDAGSDTAPEIASSSAADPAANEDSEDEDVADAPGRVARLSLIEGEVTIAPAGTEELAEAVLNRPLTSGDRVLVDRGGRAELQLGNATLYLGSGAGLSLVELSDGSLRAVLTEGSMIVRVRRKQADEVFEIATPNTTVTLLRPGEYSIEADPDAPRTTLRTRSGEAELSNERETFRVKAKQQGVFSGADTLAAQITDLGERSELEAFANDRERRDLESRSSNYVSRDVIGYEDLDEHGDWIEEPEYGHIWRPRFVEVGWVPYRHGRWAFIAPWGWTWIDQARWGFAPFHYGRWAYLKSRWCWVPGPRRFRPVYAPAVVGWTGHSNFSASVAFGSGVGWFPLGPREIFVPSYRYSRRYAHALNSSNTIIINNTTFIENIYRSGGRHGWRHGRQSAFLDYKYRNSARAVTLVERDVFIGGRGIDGRFRKLDARQWQRARHDGIPPRIDPQRSSLLAGRAVQRTGWQERFTRAERDFRPRDRRFERGLANREQDRRNGRDIIRDSQQQPRTGINGLAPERRNLGGSQRRWQEGWQRSEAERRWRERGEERRSNGQPGDQQREPRRWQEQGQDRRGDEPSQRRWQDRQTLGDDQRGERRPRWQDRGGSQQSEPPRWQDGGNQQLERRRPQQDGNPQGERRRWQQDGGGNDSSQPRRWQDRSQREERQPRRQEQDRREQSKPQAQPQRREENRRDEGRRGWQQQRSNDNGGGDRAPRGDSSQRWQNR